MRVAISLLITGLLFGSLAVNDPMSDLFLSNSDSQKLLSAKPRPSTKRPYRGSGRRELLEYFGRTQTNV